MAESDIRKQILDSMCKKNKSHIQLPEHDELLMFLHNLILITGRIDIMYCNAFLDEATQLLINAILLYEDGFFDCAFYSVRQAGEMVDSMLYLSKNDKNTLGEWAAKKRFPPDSELKSKLEKMSDDYKEIKSLIPDYFVHHAKLIKKSHKIIHKQGYDTFYIFRNQVPVQEEEIRLFTESLKYTIGIILILFIILEPISLALSDDEIAIKINYRLMTDPIDVDYFQKYLGRDDIIAKIKASKFYRNFITNFTDKEPMSFAVYDVIREEWWDVGALDEIEKQLGLLDAYQRFMFCILKCGIRISNFYFISGLIWYSTSIKCNFHRCSYGPEEFKIFLSPDNKFNQPCENVFISVITMYEENLFLEHNEPLTNDEIQALKTIEKQGIMEHQRFNKELDDLL